MKAILSAILCFFLISCTSSNLVHFANNYDEIARTEDSIPSLSARILRVREFGECIDNVCPKEVLYIAISEFGEYPEQKLYQTKEADEWHFIEWKHIPALAEQDPTISFTLKSINNNVESMHSVSANLNTIKYEIKKR